MEPHQQQPSSPPQHIPSPARHHTYHYLGHTSSSPTLCDKRLIRRFTHGTPYPQTIAIPPVPAYLSSSPVLSSRTSNGSINTITTIPPPARTPTAAPGTPTHSLLPLASPFSPPPLQSAKTTSSLARRRRSTVSSSNSPTSNPSSSPEMNSRPPPMAPPPVPNSSSTLQQMLQAQQQQQQQHQQQYQRPTSSAASTPGHSSAGNTNFWGPNYGTSNPGDSSLFVKDEMGLGGTWRSRQSWSRSSASGGPTEPENRSISPDDDGDLELKLGEAMDEDSTSDEDEEPNHDLPPPPRRHNTNGSETNAKRREAEDDLVRIAQAMTLLSLKPGAGPSEAITLGPHFPSFTGTTQAEQEGWPPHPTPESLLRESLRQSFEAYRTLKLLDKATVFGGTGARHTSVSSGASSRRQSVHMTTDHDERELSVVDVLKAYDQAAEGVKTAREVMKWAEHWIREERERTRERLLKG